MSNIRVLSTSTLLVGFAKTIIARVLVIWIESTSLVCLRHDQLRVRRHYILLLTFLFLLKQEKRFVAETSITMEASPSGVSLGGSDS
jgi:hypothetical protein